MNVIPFPASAPGASTIHEELRMLRELVDLVPGEDNRDAVLAQIEVLTHRMDRDAVLAEYEDAYACVLSSAMDAAEWLFGEAPPPSDGWRSMLPVPENGMN